MTQDTLIDFENIHVCYGNSPVLQNINLRIKAQENWVILGANGSGKSTLIRLLSNDLYPDTRYPFRKELFGKDTWNITELKKYLGIITSDLHSYFEKHRRRSTAYEIVLSGYNNSIGIFSHQKFTKKQREKVNEILEFLEIAHIKNKKACAMSTGELRRCIIGRALVLSPRAFILDEPTAGLDIKAKNSFMAFLRKLTAEASVILVTHHVEEIFQEITHGALIHNKTIVRQGKKEDILTSENLSAIFEMNINLQQEKNRYFINNTQ